MVTETPKESVANSNPLANSRIAFIGLGVMAEAIAAGLLRKGLVKPEQLVGSHPRSPRREELYAKYGIQMFEQNREAVVAAYPGDSISGSLVILGIKPQRLTKVLDELKGSIHQDQVVVSVVAGAKIETIADELLHGVFGFGRGALYFLLCSLFFELSVPDLQQSTKYKEQSTKYKALISLPSSRPSAVGRNHRKR